jgi:hypothetical protein
LAPNSQDNNVAPLDSDLFTITLNPTCDSGAGDTCFLLTPRFPLDFEDPIGIGQDNTYDLTLEVRSLGFDQVFFHFITVEDVVNEVPLVPDTNFFGGTLGNFTGNINRISDTWDELKTAVPQVGVYTWDVDTSSLNQACNGSACVGYSTVKAQYNTAYDTISFHGTGSFTNIPSLGTLTSGSFNFIFDHKALDDFVQDAPDNPGFFSLTTNGSAFGGIQLRNEVDDDLCTNSDHCVSVVRRDTVGISDLGSNNITDNIGLAVGFNFSDPPSGTGRLLLPRLEIMGTDSSGNLLGNSSAGSSSFIELGAPTTIRERAINFANSTTTPAQITISENSPSSGAIAMESNIHPLTFSFDTRTSITSDDEDNDLFTIDTSTGDLKFNSPPDFENPSDKGGNNVYDVKLKISDGLDSIFATQRILITDVAAPNANIFTSDVQAFTASVDTVVDTWEAYFALVGDGILTWDPDLSGISQVCSGSQCLDVNRFFVSYNTNTQSATLQSTGTFTNVPVAGTDTSGTYSVTFSDRAAADLVSIQDPSTFAFSTKNLGASNVLLPDSDDVVSILSNASADVSANVTIQASTHANDPTSGSFTATQVGTVSVSGTAANASSTAAVTNAIELGQPNVGTSVVNP